MTLHHPSLVPLQGGINFRDLGGYKTRDGRIVRRNVLFRAGALNELTDKDCQYLENITLKHVLDYRDDYETQEKPDRLWGNACYYNVAANPAAEDLSADLSKLDIMSLNTIDSYSFMTTLYSALPFNNPAYKKLVQLMQADDNYGLVQHCAVGKDRTGVGSALILLILGVDTQTIFEDYLLTEITLKPYKDKIIEKISSNYQGINLDNLEVAFSAKEAFLESAFNAINQRYGNLEHWLEKEFALTPQIREKIRAKYLEN